MQNKRQEAISNKNQAGLNVKLHKIQVNIKLREQAKLMQTQRKQGQINLVLALGTQAGNPGRNAMNDERTNTDWLTTQENTEGKLIWERHKH